MKACYYRMLYSQEEECVCAIFKFDKEPSQEFQECFYGRSLALRLIYTVCNSFAFSPFLVRCFVYSASFFLFPGFSEKHLLCYLVVSSQKYKKSSFPKLFLISSLRWQFQHSVMPPVPLHQKSSWVMLSGSSHPPRSLLLIPSKQGYGLNVLPKSL